MRVRYDDGLKLAGTDRLDEVQCLLIEECYQVPKDISLWRLYEDSPLTDGKTGFAVDTPNVLVDIILLEHVVVLRPNLGQRGPGLTGRWNILPWILCVGSQSSYSISTRL